MSQMLVVDAASAGRWPGSGRVADLRLEAVATDNEVRGFRPPARGTWLACLEPPLSAPWGTGSRRSGGRRAAPRTRTPPRRRDALRAEAAADLALLARDHQVALEFVGLSRHFWACGIVACRPRSNMSVYPDVRVYADPLESLTAQLTELRGLIKRVPRLIDADRERRWKEISERPSDGEDGDVVDVCGAEAGGRKRAGGSRTSVERSVSRPRSSRSRSFRSTSFANCGGGSSRRMCVAGIAASATSCRGTETPPESR
jgi:hypothetical protein